LGQPKKKLPVKSRVQKKKKKRKKQRVGSTGGKNLGGGHFFFPSRGGGGKMGFKRFDTLGPSKKKIDRSSGFGEKEKGGKKKKKKKGTRGERRKKSPKAGGGSGEKPAFAEFGGKKRGGHWGKGNKGGGFLGWAEGKTFPQIVPQKKKGLQGGIQTPRVKGEPLIIKKMVGEKKKKKNTEKKKAAT